MIGRLIVLLMIPIRCHGESLPGDILNTSANTGYKLGATKQHTNRVVGNVKHMEVYEGNREYILFLADNKLKLTNGTSTEDYHDGLVDTAFVMQSLNLQVELNWTSFFQIDSSRMILVHATIPCLILFDPEGDPQISAYLGNCTAAGTTDGGVKEGRLIAIVDVAGDTRNRSRMYVLQTDGAIREVNVENRTIRTIHDADRRLQNADCMTYNSYNKSLVITMDFGFIQFSLESKSFRVIWGYFELASILDHAEALEFIKRTGGYVINEDLLAIIYQESNTSSKVIIVSLNTKEFYTYCSYGIKGHQCPVSPQSFLSVGRKLHVGSSDNIYTFSVRPVSYCGASLGWLNNKKIPKRYEYSGLSPLATGAYTYEERLNASACENTVYLTEVAYETSTLNCTRHVDVTEKENSKSDQTFNRTFPQLSVGSTYFINKETGECEVNATVRQDPEASTPRTETSQTDMPTSRQPSDEALAVNPRNSDKGHIGAIMTILSITAVIVGSILLFLLLKQRGVNRLRSRKIRGAQRDAFQLSDHTIYNVDRRKHKT